jgi:predicted membrane-bound mannosyltransferase
MKWMHVLLAAVVCLAIAFRVPELSTRPMHADEAVLAAKVGELLEQKSYRYDPNDHHGPALAWLTYAVTKAAGVNHYRDLTEFHLRIVAALCGVFVVTIPLLLSDVMGRWNALAAAALTAISPAMVYYSRYFIPEMLLTALTGVTIVCGVRYARSRNILWAYAAAVSAGLMITAKETAVIAIACMVVAVACTAREKPRSPWSLIAPGLIVIAIPLVTFGWADSWHAVSNYLQRGLKPSAHGQPWHYYASLLVWRRGDGGPIWTEALIVALAILQIVLVIRRKGADAHNPWLRFLTIYGCALFLVYSLIPYKTPWCVLGPLQALTLLAGSGAIALLRPLHGVRRIGAAALLVACAGQLAFQSWRASFPFSSDSRNPYAYAHTGPDVKYVRDSIEEIASNHPEGRRLTLQVLSAKNLWPLPWYFRDFPNIGWWRAVESNFRPGDVILITPDMEPALIHEIYEAPPPGKRELYTVIFDRYVELRPGLELRGYVRASLATAVRK